MGLQITDGHGKGYDLKVDQEGRAWVFAISEPIQEHINEESGKVWTIYFDALNPAGANDYVVYIRNTGDNLLEIPTVRLSASAATRVNMVEVTGTPVGGTDVTPQSRQLGSSAAPTGTFQTGTDITGLTSEGVLLFEECAVADTLYTKRIESTITIPKGKAVALQVVTGTANLSGVVTMFETDLG